MGKKDNDKSVRTTGLLFLFGGLALMIISFFIQNELLFVLSILLFLIGYIGTPSDKNEKGK